MPNQISKIKKLDIEDLNKEKIFSSDLIIHSNNEGLMKFMLHLSILIKKQK